jgi:hypothetical protein
LVKFEPSYGRLNTFFTDEPCSRVNLVLRPIESSQKMIPKQFSFHCRKFALSNLPLNIPLLAKRVKKLVAKRRSPLLATSICLQSPGATSSPSLITPTVAIVSCINYLDLKQIVRGPTRLGKTLDLVLVKKIEIVTNTEISAPFVNSDHNSVIFEITVPPVPPKQILASSTILDFKQADFHSLNIFFSNYDWHEIFRNTDIDSMYEAFMATIAEGIRMLFVPMY